MSPSPVFSGRKVRERAKRWREWHPAPVDWYSPRQLVRTGLDTFLAGVIGQRIDTRLIEPVGDDHECVFSCGGARSDGDGVVFDYAADTGDGWLGTYTLAQLLSAPEIVASGAPPLRRADLVILGGDQVYPVASSDAYARRLVYPFNQAARNLYGKRISGLESVRRPIYLIPGNHDWYDSLAAFVRRFCHRRSLGAFRTKQRRSYWIVELSDGWEIWAADIQLGREVDATQFQFFSKRAESLDEHTRVILCAAEPEVVSGRRAAADRLGRTFDKLQQLVEAKGARVPLRLAGDVHNYQRYEVSRKTEAGASYPQVHIVSGGGGAFLHPTHAFYRPPERLSKNARPVPSDPAQDRLRDGLAKAWPPQHERERRTATTTTVRAEEPTLPAAASRSAGAGENRPSAETAGEKDSTAPETAGEGDFVECLQRYPAKEVSRRLTKRNLLFAFLHPRMAVFIGAIYVLLFWSVPADAGLLVLPIEHLSNVLAMILVVAGTTAFGKAKPLLGALHGVLHVALAYLVWSLGSGAVGGDSACAGTGVCACLAGGVFRTYCAVLVSFGVGSVLGATLLGVYLYVGLNVFRVHHNEAFSGLCIGDYKNFLRCRVGSDGVHVTAIAIPRVHRSEDLNPVPTLVIDEVVAK